MADRRGNDGYGHITLWGFSPALDLQEGLSCEGLSRREDGSEDEALDVVNILMIGAGDPRHILKTMAQRHRHPKRKIHIYVIEDNMQLICRHMLLLTLALEPQRRMGLQEKSELFVELYGNTLIRQPTLQYLQEKASLFMEMIGDLDYADERMPIFDLSQLKFKDRDNLHAVFKIWRNPDQRTFDIRKCWDDRLRAFFADKYDSRYGSYDWDLSFNLYERGATMIQAHEYQRWRETGVAFECRDGAIYDRLNKSIALPHFADKCGERYHIKNYLGDIRTGPFISYGVDTEEKSLLKLCNNKPSKTSSEITLHNVTAMLHELQTNEVYRLPSSNNPANVPDDIMEVDEEEAENNENHDDYVNKAGSREFYAAIPCEEVTVHFMASEELRKLHEKRKFSNFFNHSFISISMVQLLHNAHHFTPIFAPNATLHVESYKYLLGVRKQTLKQAEELVAQYAGGCGFVPRLSRHTNKPTTASDGCFYEFELDSRAKVEE